MAKELLTKYEYEMYYEKHSTELTWRLKNWSQLFHSTYATGVHSTSFYVDGTNGNAHCRAYLFPQLENKSLILEFTRIQGFELIEVTFCIGNTLLQSIQHCKPIQKTYEYAINCMLVGQHPTAEILPNSQTVSTTKTPIVGPDINDEVVIVIKINIFKLCNFFSCSYPTTLQPVLLPKSKSPRNILANFKLMFDRQAFCDVSLVLGDKTFYAHKAVLAAQSTVFEAMFLNDMKEQRDSKVEILDRDVEVFEQFLKYLYGEEVTELKKNVGDMIAVADFYDVPELKNECKSVMMESFTKNNVVEYLILADKFNCEKLKNKALRLIRNSTTVMEESFLENEFATIMCLKEILSKNPPAAETVVPSVADNSAKTEPTIID